jgi:glucosamine kinase
VVYKWLADKTPDFGKIWPAWYCIGIKPKPCLVLSSSLSSTVSRSSLGSAPSFAPRYLLGVDGGGTGTRALLQDPQGRTLGQGRAGPSSLAQGVAQAWRHVQQAVEATFADAGLQRPPWGDLALGLGLAGAELSELRAAFVAADPGYALCVLNTDAATQLAGAHGGGAGVVVAAGTGTVAAARHAQGPLQRAGGWGFPVGDEGGGAWLGLHAVQHLQCVIDGRAQPTVLSAAVAAATGGEVVAVQAWCAHAGQHAYAQLAPLVFAAAEQGDAQADALLNAAAAELARLAQALLGEGQLPIAVTGSIGTRLLPRWPAALRAQVVPAAGDSASGALLLLRAAMQAQPSARGSEAETA